MKRKFVSLALAGAALAGVAWALESAEPARPAPEAADWHLNATIIEACSCPMFCQCYFNTEPSQHPGCCPPGADPESAPRYCRFNNAFRVNAGHHGAVKLDGAKFWIAGDLGDDFSEGQMDWAVVHFDPAVTAEQRAAIVEIVGHVYPVKWNSLTVEKDLPIEWTAGGDRSVAKLDGGRAAEVVLKKTQGMTDDPVVIKNLKYWGVPRHDGFVLMANEIEAYRLGEAPWEFKGTNGFMITFDISSADVAKATEAGAAKGY